MTAETPTTNPNLDTVGKQRSRAYAKAEKRLRDANREQFTAILRQELAEFGLEPVEDKRRAKAEADLAKIQAQYPELVNPSAANAVPQRESSGLDEFAAKTDSF